MNQKDKFQKEKERFLITWLLKKLKIGDEDVSFSTWPDFIINYEGKKIGLEFTECHSLDIESNHKKGVAKTQNALYEVLNTYKDIILKRGEKSKIIFVTFEDCIYDVLRINKIEKTIIDEIDAYREMQRTKNWRRFIYIDSVDEHDLQSDLLEVSMSDGYVSQPAKPENVLVRINDKNKKLPEYKMKNQGLDIQEYWLVVDFTQDRGTDIREFSMPNVETEYKRVYLTNYNDVVQIK